RKIHVMDDVLIDLDGRMQGLCGRRKCRRVDRSSALCPGDHKAAVREPGDGRILLGLSDRWNWKFCAERRGHVVAQAEKFSFRRRLPHDNESAAWLTCNDGMSGIGNRKFRPCRIAVCREALPAHDRVGQLPADDKTAIAERGHCWS